MDKYRDRELEIYELRNAESDSWIKVCPERGGIVIGYGVNGKELLYLNKETFFDPSQNIRGGIPVLFPISGQLENGEYEWEGKTYRMPNHGLARVNPWKVEEVESSSDQASIVLSFNSSPSTLQSYPFEFEVVFTYILKGTSFVIQQEYRNNGTAPMPMYAGFHPYFKSQSKKLNLETNAEIYYDYNDNSYKELSGEMNMNGKAEAVVLVNTKDELRADLSDSKIVMEMEDDFRYIMLWVQEGKNFVCIEPWMARTGEFQRGDELRMIQPRESLRTSVTISGQ
ncbi:aldose epimerase [Rossellomorea vietnamensis]|uniref:aldose epimerase family protein n=1 Tax=Rossellomorea vietnamensis TaxID=218284 RepID=UPI0020787922|nr:aldose epimerase [Rossellomorea vietnamensis]